MKRHYLSLKLSSLVICVLLLLLIEGNAQNQKHPQLQKRRENQQFRLAESYQRRNQHAKAVRILERLYNANPGNPQYYESLLDSYLQLTMLDKAQQLINIQRQHDPDNPRYDIDYGHVLLKKGEQDQALKIWRTSLDKHSKEVGLYTLVAAIMRKNRLYQEAIEVYNEAMRKHPDKPFLLRELADFYRSRLQYEDALKYYLKYLKKEPENYQLVVRLVLTFQLDDETLVNHLAEIIQGEVKKSPKNLPLKVLAAKFYQKYQFYPEALKIYEEIENEKTRGRHLIDFARAVYADSVYSIALKAYETLIQKFPQSPYIWQAYKGAALSNLQLAKQTNQQSFAQEALRFLDEVKKRFPGRSELAGLMMVEGDIYRNFFFDLDKAISTYKEVANRAQPQSNIHERALLAIGESFLMRGDLSEASRVLMEVKTRNYIPRALYWLAKVQFYEGNYDSALVISGRILELEGLSGEVVNDIIELQGVMQYRETDAEALGLFAEADWLILQQKKSQAISKLKKALEEVVSVPFRIQLLFQVARLSIEIGNPEEALAFCNQVLTDPNLNLWADEALYMMANIMETQINNYQQAYQLYDRLLIEFPNSQFASSARKRLQKLRKENPDIVP